MNLPSRIKHDGKEYTIYPLGHRLPDKFRNALWETLSCQAGEGKCLARDDQGIYYFHTFEIDGVIYATRYYLSEAGGIEEADFYGTCET